jgi:ribosome-associated heat shock protein Hsp15
MLNSETKMRVDKWLFAARLFKTRALATKAVEGGKVRRGKTKLKPSTMIRIDDELTIRTPHEKKIVVKGLNDKRRSAQEAHLLYDEFPESILQREEAAEQHKLSREPNYRRGRPTKKERRDLDNLKK